MSSHTAQPYARSQSDDLIYVKESTRVDLIISPLLTAVPTWNVLMRSAEPGAIEKDIKASVGQVLWMWCGFQGRVTLEMWTSSRHAGSERCCWAAQPKVKKRDETLCFFYIKLSAALRAKMKTEQQLENEWDYFVQLYIKRIKSMRLSLSELYPECLCALLEFGQPTNSWQIS